MKYCMQKHGIDSTHKWAGRQVKYVYVSTHEPFIQFTKRGPFH